MTTAMLNQAKHAASYKGVGRGKPRSCVVSVGKFETKHRRISVLEGIKLGEEDVRRGLVVSHREAGRRLARWLK
jgi:hypothetical protein